MNDPWQEDVQSAIHEIVKRFDEIVLRRNKTLQPPIERQTHEHAEKRVFSRRQHHLVLWFDRPPDPAQLDQQAIAAIGSLLLTPTNAGAVAQWQGSAAYIKGMYFVLTRSTDSGTTGWYTVEIDTGILTPDFTESAPLSLDQVVAELRTTNVLRSRQTRNRPYTDNDFDAMLVTVAAN